MGWQELLDEIISKYNRIVLGYITILNIIYTIILILSFYGLYVHLKRTLYGEYYQILSSEYVPPISIIVPCYNEEKTVVENVKSLLSIEYGEFEVILVNDGSKDDSLKKLIQAFNLKEVDIIYSNHINTKSVIKRYISPKYHNLIVIDKINGGKADSLNVGINISKYPLFTAIDADSILEKNSLLRIVKPFVEEPDRVVAAGGIVRMANGAKIDKGFIEGIRLSANKLAIFQTVEYLRAFLSGRVGWSQINGLLIVSGAFGVFNKKIAKEVGGYDTKTIGEDMELVVKIHKYLRGKKEKYKVVFVPDPVCWTQGPEDFKSLRNQRKRWHRGLMDTLLKHRNMLLNPKYGLLGLIIIPYYWFFEMLGPLVEVTGYLSVLISLLYGILNFEFAVLFFIAAVLYGVFISIGSILLEEYSFRKYEKISEYLKLIFYSIIENFGYRQLTTLWRFSSYFGYRYRKNKWGDISRKDFE